MMSVRAFVRTRSDTPILRFSPSVHDDTAPHHLQESNEGDEEKEGSTRYTVVGAKWTAWASDAQIKTSCEQDSPVETKIVTMNSGRHAAFRRYRLKIHTPKTFPTPEMKFTYAYSVSSKYSGSRPAGQSTGGF